MKKVGGIWSHIICGQILYQPLNIYFFQGRNYFGRGRDNGNGNNRDNRNYGYPGQPMPDLGGGARMEIDNSSSGPSPRQGQGVLGNSGVQAPPANVFLDKADVQAPSSN